MSLNNVKNIFRIRDLLVTRAFILTFQHTVADDLAVDTTYNIMNPIFDSGNLLVSSHLQMMQIMQNPDELKILMSDADALKFWFSMALFLGSVYYINNHHLLDEKDSEASLERLKKFIPYDRVRRVTSFVVTLMMFVFVKNVMPVT
jgi:hypothetical protein